MNNARHFIVFFLLTVQASLASSEDNTINYFNQIKNNPLKLYMFLKQMPLGGDLHYHLSGGFPPEKLIHYAMNDNWCISKNTYIAYQADNCEDNYNLDNTKYDIELYNTIINQWSLRQFVANPTISRHNHFFKTFTKFSAIGAHYHDKLFADILYRASQQNIQYLELMDTLDDNLSGEIGKTIAWDGHLDKFHTRYLEKDIDQALAKAIAKLDMYQQAIGHELGCYYHHRAVGCDVETKYIYQVYRDQAPEKIYGQIIFGFILNQHDDRVVGINLVEAEDHYTPMHDYTMHMAMIGYMKKLYPQVNVTLHAGELHPELVSPRGIKSHITQAINTAQTYRIGHGVSVAYEDDAYALLNQMAEQEILVEINLTSNALLLDTANQQHPLPLYLRFGVPITLSTDDEGIFRTTLTQEYQRAIETYALDYLTIKNFSRNSLYYSFLSGEDLWQDNNYSSINSACQLEKLSQNCLTFLNANPKAAQQWELEQRFIAFEQAITEREAANLSALLVDETIKDSSEKA